MANLDDNIVATLWDQSSEVSDLVMHHNPLLNKLKANGNVRLFSGGYEVRKPARYNDSVQGAFYTGYEAFDLSAVNDLDAFQFPIRQVYEPFAISGREMRANASEEQLLDLVEEKFKACKSRLANNVSDSILGDGTRYGGREFTGITAAISTSPSTGSYGGIDRSVSTNTWARNLAVSSGGLTSANVQQYITTTMMQITRGMDAPDLAIATRTNWQLLHGTLTAIQRINDKSDVGRAGYNSIFFNGCEFIFDGGYQGSSSSILSSGIRFMNTDYWTMDIVRESNFKPIESKPVRPVDQDAFFTVILVEGALCNSAPPLSAVLT
jgi:hypothetical protein